jgi:hypothetical protein
MPTSIPSQQGSNSGPDSKASSNKANRPDDRWLNTPTMKGAKATSPGFSSTRSSKNAKKTMPLSVARPKLVADVDCPECSAPLLDPGPREWCARCGYGCALPSWTSGPEEKVPTWSWVVLGGLAVMAVLAIIVRLLGLDASGAAGLLIPAMVGTASLGVLGVVIYLIWPSQPQHTPRQPWDEEAM